MTDDSNRAKPRPSVPPPAARPWSRPPPPRDDTATTEWAAAQPHVGDATKTTEHRAASSEPITERIGRDELAAARPIAPANTATETAVPLARKGGPPAVPVDELATVKMDSPPDFMAELKREASPKQARQAMILIALTVVLAVVIGIVKHLLG